MTARSIIWAALAVLLPGAGAAEAQTISKYPVKPVRIVVGFAPGGGADIVTRLHDETVRTLGQPDAKQRIEATGLFVRTSTPEELAAYMQEQLAKWAKVVQASGARAD
jgi:tripartite-type tricarboxylate transporter receptor subunit TctC